MQHRWAWLVVALALLFPGCAETGEASNSSFTGFADLNTPGVSQTFTATNDELSHVRVWIATYGVAGPSGALEAELSHDGETVRTAAVPGTALEDLQPVTIVFEPIPDSAGKQYRLDLVWRGVHRTSVLYNEYDAYPDGELETGGDLRFELGTADRIGATLRVIPRTASHLGDSMRGDPLFWGAWLIGLLSLGGLAWRVRRRPSDDEESRAREAA